MATDKQVGTAPEVVGTDTGIPALAVRDDTLSTLTPKEGDWTQLRTNSVGALHVTGGAGLFAPGTIDGFGHLVIAEAFNQVDIQFFRDTPANLLTVTVANGGATSQVGGAGKFETSTNATGSAKGVTNQKTSYRSGSEIFAIFTATFTTGVSGSYQRIGLYDTNDGFFIGFEDASFGVTTRNGGSDTTVAKASFSEDQLTGAAGSTFTRAGVAEAVDLTKFNVYRIRFGWLGSAPIEFDILSPDNVWVTFHKIRQPGLDTVASIENPDLPITIDLVKTSGATNLIMTSNCWGAGVNTGALPLDETLTDKSLAKTVRVVMAGKNPSGVYENININDLNALEVEPEQHIDFDDMNATTGWTVLGDDTATLTTTTNHLVGTAALSFAKVNGDDNTVFGGIQKTITSVDLGDISLHDLIQVAFQIPSLAVVDYVFVRVGTDSSNYNEWRAPVLELTAATWETLGVTVGSANFSGNTGNGWNPSAVTYIAVGVAFNAETDALADILFDHLTFHTNLHSAATLGSEITSSVTSANVNVQKWGGSPAAKGAGNAGNGSPRMVIATDDVNMAAIKTAVEGAIPAGANLIGNVGLGTRTSGGAGIFRSIDLDEGTLEIVKASAGQIYWIHAINLGSTIRFIKIYNATSGTYGTGTPVLTFPVPTQGDSKGAGFTLNVPGGIPFATGISIGAGTGVADNDTGAPGANDVIVNLGFA